MIVLLRCAVSNKKLAMKARGVEVLLSTLTTAFDSSDTDCRTVLSVCLIRSIDLLLLEFSMYFTILSWQSDTSIEFKSFLLSAVTSCILLNAEMWGCCRL